MIQRSSHGGQHTCFEILTTVVSALTSVINAREAFVRSFERRREGQERLFDDTELLSNSWNRELILKF